MNIIFSYGMGLDSATILHRWLSDPNTHDVDLADLVLVSAQVGGESIDTKEQHERLVLSLLRQHHIRYVQLGRAGPSIKDGYDVLSDTRQPTTLYIEGGPWTLYQELISTGTVPQFAGNRRSCSHKFKGAIIERWIADAFGGQPYRHMFGYAADEQKRIAKALPFQADRPGETMVFPLTEWGWDRAACAAYSMTVFGEVISRSCCGFCPFAQTCGGKGEMMERYQRHLAEAVQTLLLEHLARALNPRMSLYPGGKTVLAAVQQSGNQAALDGYHAQLEALPWALYCVERIYKPGSITYRRLTTMATGNRSDLLAEAQSQQWELERDEVALRAIVRKRADGYPTTEELLVVAPHLARDMVLW